MDPVIGILDIGLGNISSVENAVYQQGVETLRVTSPTQIDDCSHLILPGVGHYAFGVKLMCETGLTQILPKFIDSGRPLLGICLGMQLLCSGSDEDGGQTGLNFFDGNFKIFKGDVRVPHMGWNEVNWTKNHAVTDGVKSGKDFYFVHSYNLSDSQFSLGNTDYHGDFVSAISRGNVLGFQFHPEKSQKNGLKLLENFCWWDGKC